MFFSDFAANLKHFHLQLQLLLTHSCSHCGGSNYTVSGRKKGKPPYSKPKGSSAECEAKIELGITAMDRPTLDSVKRQLLAKIEETVVLPAEITDQLISEMSSECERELLSLERTANVKIAIGT